MRNKTSERWIRDNAFVAAAVEPTYYRALLAICCHESAEGGMAGESHLAREHHNYCGMGAVPHRPATADGFRIFGSLKECLICLRWHAFHSIFYADAARALRSAEDAGIPIRDREVIMIRQMSDDGPGPDESYCPTDPEWADKVIHWLDYIWELLP